MFWMLWPPECRQQGGSQSSWALLDSPVGFAMHWCRLGSLGPTT